MKRPIVLLLILTAAFFSCTKEEKERDLGCLPVSSDTVIYKGTFERSAISGVQSSDVVLKFKGGVFVGSSSKDRFPAIGSGTVNSSTQTTVTFKNQNMWTADFDWTLILDGTFDAVVKNDSLKLTKFRGNDAVDTYYLARIK